MGDHGWQLGEHAEWCKNTNFDIAAHTPLIIRVPGSTEDGITTSKLVEFVDIFPTLVEAAGLGTLDTCSEDTAAEEILCTEGTSLIPLIDDPASADWKEAVFWQFPRGAPISDTVKKCMGYSIRTESYRYTEWITLELTDDDGYAYTQLWDDLCDHAELYDLTNDEEENTNVYDESAYTDIVTELSARLQAGWRDEL
jgi:iduronate 2-sulfatase